MSPMSPDRQALLSLYHDDATALLARALQAQHEPEGLHVVHAALVEALADAHTDGREPGVSTTVPDETIQAAQRALDNCGEESRMVHRDHLANALAEVRRLTDSNARLTDLVRHQRGDLHTEGLISDAEYAALAGLTGSPARLEGYDALRGELERTKRALNVAIGERDALQAIRAYLDAVVTQPGRDDFPEWHALADEDRDRLQAWGDRVCQAGMDAENEATEEAEDAARHAAEQADILLTTIRLALGDNPAGNGWKPPTGVHPVVDLALKASEERDGAVAALATARIDGARVMRERCIIVCENVEGEADADGESGRALAAHHIAQRISNLTLDPAAVVGSPEPALAECPGCEGSGSVSPSGCIRCPACEGSGTVPAAVVGSGS